MKMHCLIIAPIIMVYRMLLLLLMLLMLLMVMASLNLSLSLSLSLNRGGGRVGRRWGVRWEGRVHNYHNGPLFIIQAVITVAVALEFTCCFNLPWGCRDGSVNRIAARGLMRLYCFKNKSS
ncbi:hypothetical protein B0T17DRAFT_542170 [Bombardia bombarda]|uniref:Uncharacterized protein n=1 Tax=Bombardia bombarda TaxID=252184 RepID=A0AA39U7S3_9PEZI|nr:hypothetical protein B0T17DRAFT_542170 [Bombardia bombarda]